MKRGLCCLHDFEKSVKFGHLAILSAKQKGLKSSIEDLHVELIWGFEKAGLRDDWFDCHERCSADAKRQRRQ
ncbi:hypothetical protein BQ8482_100136 [Mesorhizobium delmotii]|uniref:Uncharacterized protein n=1 Tax=Mesorhizobium delmotii TaxID=1631247 RepID=A0A2P9A9Z5_9HYPH|nr:hypothetical protein BQ8482_100136 [Mesorhizobium delmotii]